MRSTLLILILTALTVAAAETATLTGAVYDMSREPIPDASVELYLAAESEGEEGERDGPSNLEYRPWLLVDESLYMTTTDAEGLYRIEGVLPGSYDAVCRSDYFESYYNLDLHLAAGEERRLNFALLPLMEVEKPNIYLYPEETTEVTVTLNFPQGGAVTVSDPPYGNGWTVNVEPDGWMDTGLGYVVVPASEAGGEEIIFDAPRYSYLFYEAEVPDEWQRMRGWLVNGEDLAGFFDENLHAYGFNDGEVGDFIEYWEPRLTADYYAVFPQLSGDIDPLIGLDVYPEPDSILRLYYYLVPDLILGGLLGEPEIPSFERTGFTVVEWGVCLDGELK